MRTLKMKNPPHPGLSVRVDCLDPHGLSVTEAAKILGVSRSALSNLVNESADLSWDMAIRLAKAFGATPEGWMRLQFQYDASQVEERSRAIKVKTFATGHYHGLIPRHGKDSRKALRP
jgi:antitoxin HigA-1